MGKYMLAAVFKVALKQYCNVLVIVIRMKFCIVFTCLLLVLLDVNLFTVYYLLFVCFVTFLSFVVRWLSVFFAIF